MTSFLIFTLVGLMVEQNLPNTKPHILQGVLHKIHCTFNEVCTYYQ